MSCANLIYCGASSTSEKNKSLAVTMAQNNTLFDRCRMSWTLNVNHYICNSLRFNACVTERKTISVA